MNEQDIKDTFELQYQLATILLKGELWKHKFKNIKITNLKNGSKAISNGYIHISANFLGTQNYTQLRNVINISLVDLVTGFSNREKFIWQRIAKKLGMIKETNAEDLCECELCNKLTPFTGTKRCNNCWELEKAVHHQPAIARLILERMEK